MAVAFDAFAQVTRTGTGSPQTWTHTPVGTPRCIVVFIGHGTSSTDHISAVTYGGVAMTRRMSAADAAGEPGRMDMWVLSEAFNNGGAIPTGAQTVSATCGSTTDDIWFVSISLTGNGPVTMAENVWLVETDTANTNHVYDYKGRTCLALMGMYSGQNSAASLAAGSGCTAVASITFASATFSGIVIRQTTPSAGAFTIQVTATSEDVAQCNAAFTEAYIEPQQRVMPHLLAQ